MLGKLGTTGIAGVLLLVGGLAVIAYTAPIVALGMALVLVGLLLVAKGLMSGLLESFGMGGMFEF
ncbi:DUF7470 family protein [Halomarina litorea]|uniref:DUF7470 family protein n=1 Tax=Halomarina litorea TaxID=2961595 RepID=UPI0020C33FB1|nr:hypothetical protein [Halomarina sp. BCD28]